MTTEEFIKKGNDEYGGIFKPIVKFAAGMLRRGVTDLENCLEILEDLDDYSYEG